MSFQSVIRRDLAFGIPGELAFDSPLRAQPGRISAAATAANVVIGRFFTLDTTTNEYSPGGAIDNDTIYGGILGFPKEQASFGGAGGPLSPTLNMAPGEIGVFIEMGMPVVMTDKACKVGDFVIYTLTTGAISTIAPADIGTLPVTQARIPDAVVYRTAQPDVAGGVIVIKLTQ